MCGIAGVWSTDPIDDPRPLAARLDRALAHRGPDGHASTLQDAGRLLLVHRRLAIIEPSSAGAQPMSSTDGRFTIVFNGEIYNHRELRQGLERQGECFVSASDTEVLLRLVARSGPDGLAKVRGMFAFALWDATQRTLLVARDRFGIKPLYLAARPGQIAFASEIRALTEAGLCERNVDNAAVLAFMRWGAIPGPLTWVRGVEALAPGTWRRWSVDCSSSGCFADARALWSDGDQPSEDEDDLRARTRDALHASVHAHLVADVPVGVFLSGGIDSSALIATAAAERSRLHTFTVVFDERSHDEAPFAQAVAEQFGTVHQTLRVDPNAVLDEWPAIERHLDQPTIDGVNSFFVSSAVAASGVKAIISGIGGDELFGGYPSFARVPRGARLDRMPRALRVLGANIATAADTGWRAHKLRHAASHADSTFELYRAVRGWMMPGEIAALAGPALQEREQCERVDAVEQEIAAPLGNANPYAAVARLESTMYLRQQLLRDADVMSMAHGLEVRVPFVDHELIGSVWPGLGQHPHLLPGKKLLVESLPCPLPAAIVSRPKQGFTLPFAHWIDGALGDFVSDGLAAAADGGWIAPGAPGAVRAAWKARACHWSRPWGLAVLGHFLRG